MKEKFKLKNLIYAFGILVCAIISIDVGTSEMINQNGTELILSPPENIEDLHICIEMLEPEIIEKEQEYNDSTFRAFGYPELFWKYKKILYVQFIGGDSVIKEKVVTTAKKWEDHCCIKFEFGTFDTPDITISFVPGGSWSYIGNTSKNHNPSMNFGWLKENTDQKEYDRVVLHEFGHALGFFHEHSNPDGNPIKWNVNKVYEIFQGPPNSWTKEQIDNNLFKRYEKNKINGTVFDPNSIMIYEIKPEMTLDGYSVTRNHELSTLDKNLIGLVYPK